MIIFSVLVVGRGPGFCGPTSCAPSVVSRALPWSPAASRFVPQTSVALRVLLVLVEGLVGGTTLSCTRSVASRAFP